MGLPSKPCSHTQANHVLPAFILSSDCRSLQLEAGRARDPGDARGLLRGPLECAEVRRATGCRAWSGTSTHPMPVSFPDPDARSTITRLTDHSPWGHAEGTTETNPLSALTGA